MVDHLTYRDVLQRSVARWCKEAFGEGHASSIEQRGLRLAEEAIEAAQSAGVDRDVLHKLIDYVYSKSPDPLDRELGGVGITLLSLAEAAGLSADKCERNEFNRVKSKPLSHFHERNKKKDDMGFVAKDVEE